MTVTTLGTQAIESNGNEVFDAECLRMINEYFYGVRIFPGQDPTHVRNLINKNELLEAVTLVVTFRFGSVGLQRSITYIAKTLIETKFEKLQYSLKTITSNPSDELIAKAVMSFVLMNYSMKYRKMLPAKERHKACLSDALSIQQRALSDLHAKEKRLHIVGKWNRKRNYFQPFL